MVEKIYSATTLGLNCQVIEIEIDVQNSIPSFVIVGLPDKAVQESKERVRTALNQNGFSFPLGKITANLAPAGVAKSGTQFDLPLAICILKHTGVLKIKKTESVEFFRESIFVGEIALDGNLRKVSGVLSIGLFAAKNGYKKLFVPIANLSEAQLINGVEVYAVESLNEIVDFLNGDIVIEAVKPLDLSNIVDKFNLEDENGLLPNDMAYVKGQLMAKRALEISASGGHNVMFIGQPGSGKTLLAKSYPTILPKMTEQEILDVTQIYSIAGLLDDESVIFKRPFRTPHHTSSHISIIGGGTKLKPGEISLAHRGVLFLDEFPEFSRETLEALRQPLEDGIVQISRVSGSVVYPTKFYFIAAANPTPSGFVSGDVQATTKASSNNAITRYQAKFSGPIMDRIDIHVEVNRPNKDELQSVELAEKSNVIRQRVQAARNIQIKRFENENLTCNAEMNLQEVQKFCKLDTNSQALMSKAIDSFKLSARSYIRILKLARTIADLDQQENIQIKHLSEALQFRSKIFN
jgi:magnesium chelatase family protein